MTRQMADDEVLSTLDLAANDINALSFGETGRDWPYKADLADARAAVAALQAERDALRRDVAKVCADHAAVTRDYDSLGTILRAELTDARSRAERAESALEALRGQVAGLVEKWRTKAGVTELAALEADSIGLREVADATDRSAQQFLDRADELDELLAIKERMG